MTDGVPLKEAYLDMKKVPRGAKYSENAKKKSHRMPRWAVAVICVIVTAIFMLAPPGQAISDFVYGAHLQENKLPADGKDGTRPDGIQTYADLEDVLNMSPELLLLVNENYPVKSVTTEGDVDCITVTCTYNVDGGDVEITQATYASQTAMGGEITVSGNAVRITTAFNHGTIAAYGGYEDGYGYVEAYDKNSIYTFKCKNTPQNTFTEFIEGCCLRGE